VVTMSWDKIWAFNKKVIDPIAPRYTALEVEGLVPVDIVSTFDPTKEEVPLHPKNADVGTKGIWRTRRVLVEWVDTALMKEGDVVTFIQWGNMKIVSLQKNAQGVVESVSAELDLDNKDYKKTLKVTWLPDDTLIPEDAGKNVRLQCAYYDHIISKPIVGKDEDWKDYINKDSLKYKTMVGEFEVRSLMRGDIIQLQRKEYFIVDKAAPEMVLIEIPDGSVAKGSEGAAQPDNKQKPLSKKQQKKQAAANAEENKN